MSNEPEARQTPQDDTTRLEQTVQNESPRTDPTEPLDRPDATRAIEVEEQQSVETDDELIRFDAQPSDRVAPDRGAADQDAADQDAAEHGRDEQGDGGSPWPPATPERPSGPHAPAIVLGLVCLAVAGIVLAEELGTLTVDWGDVGPLGIVAAGAVLVLFGLVGLLGSRRAKS